MKTLLFVLSSVMVCAVTEAATNPITPTQDKPAVLYTESYMDGEGAGGAGVTSQPQGTTASDLIGIYFCDWTQEGGGSGGQFYLDQEVENNTGWTCTSVRTESTQMNNPPSTTPGQALGTDSGVHYSSVSYDPSSAGVSGSWTNQINIDWEAPVWWEHCAVLMPYPMGQPGRWAGSEFGLTTGIYGRMADAVVKLKTGGKAKSKLQNLFCLTGVAAGVTDKMSYSDGYEDTYGNYDIYGPTGTLPIPPQNVTIMEKALDINSNVYVVLPDNADLDVTPRVQGEDFYAFNVQQQKYHCWFTAYAEEPNPGDGKWAGYGGHTAGFGHSWWSLSTDAPTEGLQAVGVPHLDFLGGAAGYFPTNQTYWLILVDVPGVLKYPDGGGTETVHRRRECGINGLIGGLTYTANVSAYPDYYDLFDQNCTTVTVKAGAHSGVTLPNDVYPQNFGIDLDALPPDE